LAATGAAAAGAWVASEPVSAGAGGASVEQADKANTTMSIIDSNFLNISSPLI
jgi:hypothetical protein